MTTVKFDVHLAQRVAWYHKVPHREVLAGVIHGLALGEADLELNIRIRETYVVKRLSANVSE